MLRDIYVVAGYKIEKLNYLRKMGVNVIYNPKFREFNNIYSFYLAKNHVKEDFILFYLMETPLSIKEFSLIY